MEEKNVSAIFDLTEEEALSGYLLAGVKEQRKKKQIINTCLVAVLELIVGSQIYVTPDKKFYYILAAIGFLIIGYIWISPNYLDKKISSDATKDKHYEVYANENGISVVLNGGEEEALPKEQISRVKENEQVFLIFIESGKMLIVPKRAISDVSKFSEYLR